MNLRGYWSVFPIWMFQLWKETVWLSSLQDVTDRQQKISWKEREDCWKWGVVRVMKLIHGRENNMKSEKKKKQFCFFVSLLGCCHWREKKNCSLIWVLFSSPCKNFLNVRLIFTSSSFISQEIRADVLCSQRDKDLKITFRTLLTADYRRYIDSGLPRTYWQRITADILTADYRGYFFFQSLAGTKKQGVCAMLL